MSEGELPDVREVSISFWYPPHGTGRGKQCQLIKIPHFAFLNHPSLSVDIPVSMSLRLENKVSKIALTINKEVLYTKIPSLNLFWI